MGRVIKLSEAKPIQPKHETFNHEGQKYTVTYDPNAPEHQRWVWELHYVQTYQFFGSSPTLEAARQRANKRIRSLNAREDDGE